MTTFPARLNTRETAASGHQAGLQWPESSPALVTMQAPEHSGMDERMDENLADTGSGQ